MIRGFDLGEGTRLSCIFLANLEDGRFSTVVFSGRALTHRETRNAAPNSGSHEKQTGQRDVSKRRKSLAQSIVLICPAPKSCQTFPESETCVPPPSQLRPTHFKQLTHIGEPDHCHRLGETIRMG